MHALSYITDSKRAKDAHHAAYVTPKGAMEKMPMLESCGLSGYRISWNPATTRFVEVPMSVHVPPNVAAAASNGEIGEINALSKQVLGFYVTSHHLLFLCATKAARACWRAH